VDPAETTTILLNFPLSSAMTSLFSYLVN